MNLSLSFLRLIAVAATASAFTQQTAFLGTSVRTPAALQTASSTTELCMKYTLVLIRHGESTWNNENRFTGWYDCPLSDKGEEEATEGGRLLKEAGFTFDKAYTSTLKRAIKTLWLCLEQLDLMYIPIVNNWR